MSVPERVRVAPSPLSGRVRVPGDKSISHRALMLSALADGGGAVSGLADSEDVRSTAGCLRSLGARIDLAQTENGNLEGTVTGRLGEATDVLDCGNSGTAMRLLAGLVAGIDGLAVLTGDASLRQRPMDRVAVPLRQLGARVDARQGGSLPPLVVRGGSLVGVEYDSPVASAQVKSCVLLAALGARGRTTVVSPHRSRDHTERLLTYLGGDVTTTLGDAGQEVVSLEPGPLTARPIAVPADPSSAAFWLVAAACAGDGVTCPDISVNPTRTGFLDVLGELGAPVTVAAERHEAGEPVAEVSVKSGLDGGALVEGAAVVDAIDELPILALAGAMSRDGLEVRDAAELRVKESDRISTLATAIRALGMEIEEREDGYRVPGGQRPAGGTVDAHGDHRIAMTACIAGTFAEAPVEVHGMDAVATSYPSFLDDLVSLGGRIEAV